MKLSRIDKTIKVDPIKMSLFDSTKNIHEMLISDFIDQKLEEFLMIHAPDEMQKLKIQKLEAELLEANEALREIEFMMKMKKQQQTNVKKDVDDEATKLKEYRERMYQKYLKTFKHQLSKRIQFDWSKIQDDFRFKNKADTQDWIYARLEKDGLKV